MRDGFAGESRRGGVPPDPVGSSTIVRVSLVSYAGRMLGFGVDELEYAQEVFRVGDNGTESGGCIEEEARLGGGPS